jgi:hypothetical protein
MDPVAATSNDPSSNDPSKGQEDPWEKACVLTLGRPSDSLKDNTSLTPSKMAEAFEVTQVFGC